MDEDELPEGEMVELEDDATDVEDTEDGGAMIRIEDAADLERATEHFANIVDDVDQKMLAEAVTDLLEKIERDTERDYFMSAAEAAEYGLVDKVIDKRGA